MEKTSSIWPNLLSPPLEFIGLKQKTLTVFLSELKVYITIAKV